MLDRVTAMEYVAAPGNGRTKPAHLVCEKPDGTTVELIAKVSATCEEGVVHLAREVIAACLAGDLGLPVPVPHLVEFSPAFADIIPDVDRRESFRASAPLAFGSTLITGQYGTWTSGTRISDALLPTAAAIFAFDAIVQNPDRRDGNANCLVKGDQCRIFDHELCFAHDKILFWKPPWVLGGLNSLTTPGHHIFRAGLLGREVDWSPVQARWQGLSDERIATYENVIPPEWSAATAHVAVAVALIRNARDNFEGCLQEIKRVLT
ncbi:MAG: hypothetical protein HC829_01205 [Bacteroidales bacterium]|nr:hypothetical protein [Bacteroidales bacterium]